MDVEEGSTALPSQYGTEFTDVSGQDLQIYDDTGDLESLSDEDVDIFRSYDDGRTGVSIDQEVGGAPFSRPEQVAMIHLRRYLDTLAEHVAERDFILQRTREELDKCHSQVQQLETERDLVFDEIQTAENAGNTSAAYRLRAKHERLCRELINEQELEAKIRTAAAQAEYELSQAQVEQGKYLLAEDELQEKEDQWRHQRAGAAIERKSKEDSYAKEAEKRHRVRQRELSEMMQDLEARRQHRIEEAQRSKEKHSKFLAETVSKLKRRKEEEEERDKKHTEARMKSILSLKKDIEANRENLKAIQARERARGKQEKSVEEKQRADILTKGGNPGVIMTRQQHLNQFEREKALFLAKQREHQVDIAEKILEEEERIQRRRSQQPQLWDDATRDRQKVVKPHRKRKVKMFEDSAPPPPEVQLRCFEELEAEESEDDGSPRGKPSVVDRKVQSPDSEEEEGSENLAKPEFEGLWDRHKPYKVPKGVDVGTRIPGGSKMDQLHGKVTGGRKYSLDRYVKPNKPKHIQPLRRSQDKEILQRGLDKQRSGIVTKQVAGGKEFKGQAFYSKPDIIHFKDFEVGKSYKKKVTLTNVSYSVNYCKLTGLTEHLKDFIEIIFDPPGQMSAGLTCDMVVTFKPMINEDLEGEVSFMAHTGPFSIPIRCSTKKCDLKVDRGQVEFGTMVIGETLKRTFTLTNSGALGSHFEFFKVTGMKQRTVTTAETSLGRLTTADTLRGVSPDSEELANKTKAGTDQPAIKTEEKKESHLKQNQEQQVGRDNEEKVKETEQGTDRAENGGLGEKVDQEPLQIDGGEVGDMVDHQEILPQEEVQRDVVDRGTSEAASIEVEELASLDGMTIGQVSSGEIGPFSSVKLEIVWQPTLPGHVEAEFSISFTDPLSDNITISATARAIDVPVWVERQDVDLKICMFDRLYQDTIIVNNRATTALRLKFEVCKELRNHLELLPKTGYIQAQAQFSAQLKFLPRPGLFEEAAKYFDKDTGVLQAPMTIRVADQTRPVNFTVHAVVTTSDLSFDVNSVDFGCCTINETARKTIELTNHSILPQQFGFVGVPEYMDIQPNDGFGTLLPMETIELDLLFQPSRARELTFDLTCKSLINREFKIRCKGVAVHPPLSLSHQVVHFAATTMNDVSTAAIHVVNSHTNMNEFSHPVPRIGKGEIAPVGPTSFEFVVPDGAPITVAPSVGTVLPGKKCCVQIRFSPTLEDAAIRKEAVRMVTKAMEARAMEEYKAALEKEKEAETQVQQRRKRQRQGKGKKPAPSEKGKAAPQKAKGPGRGPGDSQTGISLKGPAPIVAPSVDSIDGSSDEYAAAAASLLRQFRGNFQSFTIPCYIASGKPRNPGELPYSIHNTLYVDVHCPTIKPELVIISDNGRSTTDFRDVSLGQSIIKSITIQNISDKHLDLNSSVLDTSGPFSMLNALRLLPPDASHTLLICFTPLTAKVFQEVFKVHTVTSTLHMTMKGHGVSPMVSVSVQQGLMDMGTVIANEYKEDTFKITNTSLLAIQYSISLDSQSLRYHSQMQELPPFVCRDPKTKATVGTQNNSGQNVFDCVPVEGRILPGKTQEVTVTFAPDHQSDNYHDTVRLELFGMEESHVFRLHGAAKAHIMYLGGGDDLTPGVESLAVLPVEDTDEDTKPPSIPLLVTLHSIASDDGFSTASKDIHVGCVRTMAVSQKKNGEWSFDNVAPLTQLGFTIDPQKGMIEAASQKSITITWTPPAGYNANQPVEASINCTVKGDVTEVYKILLRALVVTE